MPLTLHVGPRRSAIERTLVERWRDGGGLLVARDEGAAGRILRAALADGRALWDCRAGTFATLVGLVRGRAGLPPRESRHGLALRYAIAEHLPDRGAGHVRPLERLILELRAAGADPDEVTRAASAIAFAPLRDAARVYAAVRDVPSPDEEAWEAVAAAGELAIGPVITVGFDDYPPLEWALLRALAGRNDVHAALAYEPSRAVYAARHGRVTAWEAYADRLERYPPEPAPGGLDHLARCLFERVAPAAEADGVEWHEAAGTDVMYRVVMEAVVAALAEGVPPDEIAVVVPRLADEREAVLGPLAEAGVPTRHATRLPFAASPLGRALVHLWAFACDEDGPESLDRLLAWLRSPYAGAAPAEVDGFERAMRRRTDVGRGHLLARWEGAAIAPARALRAMDGAPLRRQAEYLVRLGFERLESLPSNGDRPTAADRRDEAALAALGGLADELTDDDPPARRGDVLPGRLGALLADVTFPEREGPPAGVAVLDAAQVRGLRFRHVIVCGLEEGSFPAGPAVDPYLPDDLRGRLGFLPPRAPGTSEALLRFHAACAAADERLVLVRRFADDDGRELAPSPYWNETRRLLGRPAGARERRRARLVGTPAAAATAAERDRTLALERRLATPALAAAIARRERRLGIPDGLPGVDVVRVTDLETYRACAYGWFVDRFLRPEALAEEFDFAAEGTFGHDVLERAFKELDGRGIGACNHANLPAYLEAVEHAVDAVAGERRPPEAGRAYDAFVGTLRAKLRRRLTEEADRGPRFDPCRFELKLGDDDLVPGVHLSGTCDRVDRSDDGRWAFVVDYKRSGRALDKEGESYLQIPLYAAMAAREVGAEPAGGGYFGIAKARADWRARSDAQPYNRVAKEEWLEPPEVWEQRLGDARADAAGAIRAIRAGALAPPAGCTSHWCGHGLVWRS
jgi:RecB family exonuclease